MIGYRCSDADKNGRWWNTGPPDGGPGLFGVDYMRLTRCAFQDQQERARAREQQVSIDPPRLGMLQSEPHVLWGFLDNEIYLFLVLVLVYRRFISHEL